MRISVLYIFCIVALGVVDRLFATPPPSITVVSDDNYPPYIFRDANGQVAGILPDQWKLWEKKTGIKVNLKAMDWAEAQRVIQAGQSDVIDTIFLTDERAQIFDFTSPYAKIEVPVFAHKSLGGITDVDSLQGFSVGFKEGDAVENYLTNRGISNLQAYPSYEAIIQAAKNEEIKVFSVDQPAAIYYLYKYDIADEFRQSFVLYTGEFHRAVQKGNSELLALVEDGFRKISKREYDEINRKWMGLPIEWTVVLRRYAPILELATALFLLLAGGNLYLRRRVRIKTCELRHALETREKNLAELKKSEEELRKSHEYFSTLFNSTSDAVFIHNATTGEILDVNRRMLEMYGFPSLKEVISSFTDVPDIAPPFSKNDALTWMKKACTEGPQTFEWLARHLDGHTFWVEVCIRRFQIGSDDRLIVTVRNIAERKKAEAERLGYERRMLEAQKLESLGLLAGGIAHDFNNLLTAILGNIDLALLDIPHTSSARDDLVTAMTATRRAAELAQQMLAYSGKGRFVIERVNVPATIQEIVQMMKASISKSANLQLLFPESLPDIEVDANQLRQVIMNLVINASESLENKSGSIRLSAGVVDGEQLLPAKIWPHEPLPSGAYLYIEVTDSGSGIPPHLIEKIFDPFFSTKFIGRGLGLCAVLGIVRGHKGAIQVDSAIGKGTTFRVFFPACSKPASDIVAPPSSPPPNGSDVLLLVDDEASVRDTATKLLTLLGYQVVCAADGEQAIALFRGQATRISGVILDLTMPHLDGVQTLAKLRTIRSDIPVIISSGYSEQDVLLRFAGMKLNGFISKPYTLVGLRTVLSQSLPALSLPPQVVAE